MAGAAPAPARISGNIAASCRASRHAASTGGVRRATIIFMCASRNGKPRIRSGSGRTARPRWCSRRRWSSKTKLDRALVIAFALAEILVEGGERVGIPGLMRPSASRNVIDKMAQAILHDTAERTSLPPGFAPSPLSEVVLLSDFWSPIPDFRRTLAQVSGALRACHVVQVVDPAEETFPYSGRVEFLEPEGSAASPPAAPKPGATIISRGSPPIAPPCARKRSGCARASSSIAPIARPANWCSPCMPAWAKAATRRSSRRHATAQAEAGA